MKYRILLVGDNFLIPTGYGNQLKELAKYFLEKKHEVVLLDTSYPVDRFGKGFYKVEQFCEEFFSKAHDLDLPFLDYRDELKGAVITFKRSNEAFPFKDIREVFTESQSDIFIVLKDINNYPRDFYLNAPSIVWCPLDSFPLSPSILQNLDKFSDIVGISNYGKQQFIDYGYSNAKFISHSLNTDLLLEINKLSKNECRKQFNLPEDKFIVSMIASNSESNDRKGWSFNIEGFKKFNEKYSNSLIFFNTNIRGLRNLKDIENQLLGLDLKQYLDYINLKNYKVIPSSMFRKYTQEAMYKMIRASDVILSCSRGEGCGLLSLESQALGVPVISTDFTAMTENNYHKDLLVKPYCLEWKQSNSFHAIPNIEEICDKLELVYLNQFKYRDNENIKKNILKNTDYRLNGDKWIKLIDNTISNFKQKKVKLVHY